MKKPNSPETILSIERALVILKRLAAYKEEVGVRDLSRELGYSPAVTQKTLNTLKSHDFVHQNEATGRYSLGFGTVKVGLAMLDRLDVVRIAYPHMEALTDETEETTFLAIRDSLYAVYISKVISPNVIRMDAEVGSNRPLNCTAVGKVFLAWGKDDLLTKMFEAEAFVQATENSITDPEILMDQLKLIRQQGFALDQREFHKEGICIAAPILNQTGDVIASITTSGLASRMEGRLDEFSAFVKKKGVLISRSMGYSD